MKTVKRLSIFALLFLSIAVIFLGCGGSGGGDGAESNFTYIALESDAGDYIGQGKNYLYTNADTVITVNATGGRLTVNTDGDESWNATFQLPDTYSELQPGSYDNLTRYPFHDPAVGGLSWDGEGRGCNTLTGWIIIDKVTYVENTLTEIELQFEQHCEGGAAALHGEIKWYAADTTTPPGPVTPLPTGLWEPAPELLPVSGNYVYLESESGDYIGQGSDYLYTEPTDTITVSSTDNRVTVSVGGWNATFQGMNSITELEQGYYGTLQRYPFHNPAKGGLSWSGNGRSCNSLSGWFVVDSITYVGGTLSAIDLRFEQHCEGDTPALNGKVSWSQ